MKYLVFCFLISIFVYAKQNRTNALSQEDSPYLMQHIHNPVNWYPWGEEALNKAKKENKLIFLSIGYSTCHWCHVMEEESFTDKEVAKLLNDDFISIKVDREEYPQIDKKYQQLYMALNGKRGGWPLSIFLSPEGELFHLATYIPKEEGYGSKGLMYLLPSFVKTQKDHKKFEALIEAHKVKESNKRLDAKHKLQIIDKVMEGIGQQYDDKYGGFAQRPKFPEASKIELLLDIYRLNGDKKAFKMAQTTLSKMAQGGIYDQIGGGFFRYTTDYGWQIPHFEKMLYTNGELVSVYAKAYAMEKNTFYKKIVDETIELMEERYMQDGVYFSASDADSDGEEGAYFIFAYEEVKSALKLRGWTEAEIEASLAYLGIEEDGNIDGDFSNPHITSEVVPKRLEELKNYLRAESGKRTFPFIDKKINTAWNAMMIKGLFEASHMDEKYLELGQTRLESLWEMMHPKEILYHQTLLGKKPKQEGLLEDSAFLTDALLVGYTYTYDERYLQRAKVLAKEAIDKFYKQKQWYLSDDGLEVKADFDDRYYTSALSVMLDSLVRLTSLSNDLYFIEVVQETITHHGGILKSDPSFAPKLVATQLRIERGDIVIHASKEKLRQVQKQIKSIAYPFVLSAVQEGDEYLACKTTMCFANDTNITKLIEKINKVIE